MLLTVTPRSSAPIAQLVEYAHFRISQTGVVYCGIPTTARRAWGVFKDLWLQNLIVCVIGRVQRLETASVRYILFASLPDSLETYLESIETVRNRVLGAHCELVYSPDDAAKSRSVGHARSAPQVMDKYCQTQRCCYVQIVRHFSPGCPLPRVHEFSCDYCDVYLSEPRGCYEDDSCPSWFNS